MPHLYLFLCKKKAKALRFGICHSLPLLNFNLIWPPPPCTLASRGLEEPAHALRGLEEHFFQLCCCVSFWFRREIGFGCTYYYVLGVPYSCGVLLVFLVLVGNRFWCYVRTQCTIKLCGCVIFFGLAGKLLSVQCTVVLLCQFLVVAGNSLY